MGSTVLTPPKTKRSKEDAGLEHGGNGFRDRGFGGDGASGGGGSEWAVPVRAYHTGMWMALAAIVMIFAAFTSALVVRKGLGGDWVSTGLPRILYLNTAVLLVSSLALEWARRALHFGEESRFRQGLYVTLALGVVFIAGQLAAWRELAHRGVYLSTNPSSSFFYLLTAAHGLHLLGGICALAYAAICARRLVLDARGHAVVDITALYWHFMDGLWIYLLILLMVRS
jgi:cytochrome c oxidase subunit III